MTVNKININYVNVIGIIFLVLFSCSSENEQEYVTLVDPNLTLGEVLEYQITMRQEVQVTLDNVKDNTVMTGSYNLTISRQIADLLVASTSEAIVVEMDSGEFMLNYNGFQESYTFESIFDDDALEAFREGNSIRFLLPINNDGTINLSPLTSVISSATQYDGIGGFQQFLGELFQNQFRINNNRRIRIGEKFSLTNNPSTRTYPQPQITWEVIESNEDDYLMRGTGVYKLPRQPGIDLEVEGTVVLQQKNSFVHGFPIWSTSRSTLFGTATIDSYQDPLVLTIQNQMTLSLK